MFFKNIDALTSIAHSWDQERKRANEPTARKKDVHHSLTRMTAFEEAAAWIIIERDEKENGRPQILPTHTKVVAELIRLSKREA